MSSGDSSVPRIDGWEVGEMIAYQGKEGCRDPRCRRMITPDGEVGSCMGYHCPKCDGPCSMMGHKVCPEAVTSS
jgi:hypothetical protein